MQKNLRSCNSDHGILGWYTCTTSPGCFLSLAFLEAAFAYQRSIEDAVVIVYGKPDF